MARLNDKPDEFRPGRRLLSASDLNDMAGAGVRQVVGGEGVEVDQFGDRFRVNAPRSVRGVPDVVNYLQTFVVLQEYDDYLKCVPFHVPSDTLDEATANWVPYQYDATFGTDAAEFIYVAKPPEFQRSYWDGKTLPANQDGLSMAYAWSSLGVRNADDQNGKHYREWLRPKYAAGSLIKAVMAVTGVTGADGYLSVWTDLNWEGRGWYRVEYQHFATVNDIRKDADGRVRATLVSVIDTHVDDAEVIRVKGINADGFVSGRNYPVWPTSLVCQPAVGNCSSAAGGAPATYGLVVSGMPSPFTSLNGTFTMTYTGASCVWKSTTSSTKWTLDLSAGTLVGTVPSTADTTTYTVTPSLTDALVTLGFNYTSDSSSLHVAGGMPASLTLTPGSGCDGPHVGWGTAPKYRIWTADPRDSDVCVGWLGTSVVVLADVSVTCVSGVLTVTKTFKTLVAECGRIRSLS